VVAFVAMKRSLYYTNLCFLPLDLSISIYCLQPTSNSVVDE